MSDVEFGASFYLFLYCIGSIAFEDIDERMVLDGCRNCNLELKDLGEKNADDVIISLIIPEVRFTLHFVYIVGYFGVGCL